MYQNESATGIHIFKGSWVHNKIKQKGQRVPIYSLSHRPHTQPAPPSTPPTAVVHSLQ